LAKLKPNNIFDLSKKIVWGEFKYFATLSEFEKSLPEKAMGLSFSSKIGKIILFLNLS
jgi:hypothetical protein